MNRAALFSAIIQAVRPWSLLAGVLLYALGGGIANYLGEPIDWTIYWLGQGAVTTLQISSYLLRAYFDLVEMPLPRTREDGSDPQAPRAAFIQIAATTLTVGAVLTVLLVWNGALNLAAMVILSVSFLLALAYAVPPLRLVYSGYGELVVAITQANFFPALAFMLQAGELHRLLALLTFPLTFLYLAAGLSRSLQSYLDDLRRDRKTMLVRLGWQRGMNFHNLLILAAYLLLAVSVAAGLEWRLALPAFFSLPVALFQIWQIYSIANGAKPRWRLLSFTAMAILAFTVYFMNLALWTE